MFYFDPQAGQETMGNPFDIGVIDLMLQIPGTDNRAWYDFMQPLFMDTASKNYSKMPVEYMFRNVPDIHEHDDHIAYTVAKMDAFGIEKAMIGVQHEISQEAVRRFPRSLLRQLARQPEQRHGRGARHRSSEGRARHSLRHRLPQRLCAAGAHRRRALVPHLRQVHRARSTLRLHGGRARGRASRWTRRRSSASTRCAGSSPSSSSSCVTALNLGPISR